MGQIKNIKLHIVTDIKAMAFVPVDIITKSQSSDRFHILPTFEELRRRYQRLNEQRKQKIFCDVTIQCRETYYHAHSSVLGSISPYFRALLTSPLHSKSTGETTASLHQFSEETIALLLDVIYADAVIELQYVPEMLRLADFLQFDWLLDRLIELIRPTLDATNCFDWLEIAKTFGIEKLKLLSESYIHVNFEQVFGMAEYKDEALSMEKDIKFDREIIFYCNYNSIHVIDPGALSCVRQETGPANITSLLPMLGELETLENFRPSCCFAYRNQLHTVTCFDIRTPSSGLRESCIEIQTYHELTQEYTENCRLQTSRILYDDFLFQDYTDCKRLSTWRASEAGFVLQQCSFDSRENIYLLFESAQLEEVLVYKLSVKTKQCSTNYIRLHTGEDNDKFKFVQSNKFGTLLFQNIEQIYLLDEFDFQRRGNWEPMQLQTQPYTGNETLDMESDEPYMDQENDDCNFERFDIQWDTLSVDGEIYYFGISVHNHSNFKVLKLNTDTLSWQSITEIPYKANEQPYMNEAQPNKACCISGEITNSFCCNGEMFLVFTSPPCSTTSNEDDNKLGGNHDLVWRYDPVQGSLIDTGIKIPTGSMYNPFTLPDHVLL